MKEVTINMQLDLKNTYNRKKFRVNFVKPNIYEHYTYNERNERNPEICVPTWKKKFGNQVNILRQLEKTKHDIVVNMFIVHTRN